jgi:hypothetical protein
MHFESHGVARPDAERQRTGRDSDIAVYCMLFAEVLVRHRMRCSDPAGQSLAGPTFQRYRATARWSA